jgi:hypothetical protein
MADAHTTSIEGASSNKRSIDGAVITNINTKIVTLPGMKSKLRFSQDQVVIVGDAETEFVKLTPSSSSLVTVVCEGNDNAPRPVPKNFTLGSCREWTELIQMRNTAQALELNSQSCALFANAVESVVTSNNIPHLPRKGTKKRRAIDSKHTMHRDDAAITIQVNIGGFEYDITLLRPVNATDALCVELSPDSIAVLIAYLRASSFDGDNIIGNLNRSKDVELPTGIQHKGNFFLAYYIGRDDAMHGKKCLDIESAIAFRATLDSSGMQPEADDETPDFVDDVIAGDVDAQSAIGNSDAQSAIDKAGQ